MINEQHQTIINLINRKRLKEALALLEKHAADSANPDLRQKLEQTQTSYNYMLQYMRQDVTDPGRKELHRKLLTDAMEIADQLKIEKQDPLSTSYYYTVRKNLPPYTIKHALMELESYTEDMAVENLLNNNQTDNTSNIRKQHEEAYKNLFLITWTNHGWSTQDESEAHELLQSPAAPVNELCLFVSAITLSLMECFDLRKLLYLFDAYNHNAPEINQRALIGIVCIIRIYANRLPLYPQVTARLTLLNENQNFGAELNRICIQLLHSRETEKIDKKMREEIIPEMLKNVKNLQRTKFNFEETEEEKNDHNPDWQDQLEQSALGDKIREMNDLQLEGADIYMSTFSTLKNYPFFKDIANWFYPFDKKHTEIIKEIDSLESNAVIDMILRSTYFCDSDKYSLCFTLSHIPKVQRDMMISQLNAGQDPEEINSRLRAKAPEERAKQPEAVAGQYLRNLYRFFKLYPRRHEFQDIFNQPVELHKYPVLRDILRKPDFLLKIADFYFRKDHPQEAVETYTDVITLAGGNAEIYQKIGYCKQKEKKYPEAVEAYLKADMIRPDNLWTNLHLATCYRIMKSFDKALKYYRKTEEVQPDKPATLFYIGSCLAGLEKYEEALNCFYKFDLLDGDHPKTWRAIGWCSYVLGKHEQAKKYYEKLLSKAPELSDYLNAGHVAWSLKSTNKACELYSKALEMCEDKEEFIELFYKDKAILIEQGVNEDDISLMPDLL